LVPKAGFLDEQGRSNAAAYFLLARTVGGAVLGSTYGNTDSERVQNALIGAGLLGFGPTAVTKITKWLAANAPAVRNPVRKPIAQHPPEVQQDLERLFTGYEADLSAFTRGHRPHSQAWNEAEQMIRDGRMSLEEIKARWPGQTVNDSEAM